MSISKNRDTADLFEEIKKISEDAANILRKEYPNVNDLLRLKKKGLKKHLPTILQRNNRKKILGLINDYKQKNRDTADLFEKIKKISEDAANILRKEYPNENDLLRLTKKGLKKHLPTILQRNKRQRILGLINDYRQAATSEASVSGRHSFLKFKKPVKVNVLVAGETFQTHERFMKNLKVKQVPAQESYVILVFCPVVSRIGTDMEAAMARVTEDKPVILVFMHHCHNSSHMTNITVQPSENIVKIVHCAFLETKGLLQCKENNLAVEAVRSELKKY